MAKKQSKKAKQNSELYLIAHNIRSLYNVGSIFRNADAFGVTKVFLTGYTGAPEGDNESKIHKVALGAEQFVPWEKQKSLVRVVKKLRAKGARITALENNVDYKVFPLPKYQAKPVMALILGEETKGNTKKILDLADDILEIPIVGSKESLNVSVACAVALYGIKTK